MPKYQTIKTYGNDRGFSCAFRQWRADSHCHFVHGYSLGFEFTLECETLDDKNWCYDYGSFKNIKAYLETAFDHTTAVAEDDPMLDHFYKLNAAGLIQLRIMEHVGCEKFAEHVFHVAKGMIEIAAGDRVKLVSVKVFEHGANAAVYHG